MESAASATVPLGSIATLTGGPTTEFFSGREATIFGLSGSATSTIRTWSLPGAARIGLPSSSHSSFSSRPTIMNGFPCAEPKRLALRRIAVATDNPTACLADILAFSQNIRLSCRPVWTAYARNHALASLAASLADVHLCPLLAPLRHDDGLWKRLLSRVDRK